MLCAGGTAGNITFSSSNASNNLIDAREADTSLIASRSSYQDDVVYNITLHIQQAREQRTPDAVHDAAQADSTFSS
jgi:hypothetical protein